MNVISKLPANRVCIRIDLKDYTAQNMQQYQYDSEHIAMFLALSFRDGHKICVDVDGNSLDCSEALNDYLHELRDMFDYAPMIISTSIEDWSQEKINACLANGISPHITNFIDCYTSKNTGSGMREADILQCVLSDQSDNNPVVVQDTTGQVLQVLTMPTEEISKILKERHAPMHIGGCESILIKQIDFTYDGRGIKFIVENTSGNKPFFH